MKTNQTLTLILFVLFSLNAAAQNVGIGTTTPNASLDIKSSNQALPANTDGLLIPKIDAFPVTNPTALQDGMMVYLTANVGLNLKGFYSWDNATAVWKAISNPASTNNWGLTGNAGTNPATNFIGTTDDVDLVFKRNNIKSGTITNSSVGLGYISLNSLQPNASYNTAMGVSSLRMTTTGVENTGLGANALLFNKTSYGNTAVGFEASKNNDGGLYNTSIGHKALFNNATGNNNTAIGRNALINTISGNHNIGIGYAADVADPNGNDQLSIANVIYGKDLSNPISGKIGIGVTVPTEKLEVAGKTKTTDLQVTNGAVAGNVLTSDAAGNGIWTALPAPPTQSQDWGRTGNSGTNPATNFIGTTDDTDLVFKRNNISSGRIGALNTSFGSEALKSNTTGQHNIAFGRGALQNNLDGFSNTALGSWSLTSNTSGYQNTAVGRDAMYVNTTGYYNNAFGNGALSSNTSGSSNTAIGFETMAINSTGNENTAVGNGALRNNTSGSASIAFGANALRNNSTGTGNAAIGKDALINNSTGYNNTAVGFEGMFDNEIGYNNTAVGVEALRSNTSGDHNNAIGNYALRENIYGVSNTAIGFGGMRFNTTGNENVAVGTEAFRNNTTGSNTVAIGFNAMRKNVNGSGNVAVGRTSMYELTTGNNNVIIGNNGANALTSGSNNIAIGAYTNFINNSGSNQLNIGNQIFGNGLTGTVSAPAGNIGIGTASPTNTLEIKSTTANTSGLTFTNLNSTSPTNTATAIGVNASGQVVAIADGSLNNWSKTGNGATTPGINFIGTTDDNDLVFKRNNILSGIITTDNLSFGYDALTANTTGTGNTAIGSFALKTNTLGFNNTALGTSTLQNNSSPSASRNTAIGAYAMQFNQTGQDNTAIGSSALTLISSGTGNTAVGQGALFQLQSGASENTVVGRESMSGASASGSRNAALGAWILRSNTAGALNTAAGYTSMNANTTGNNNAVYGAEGLFSNTTGSNNTAIGYRAGRTASSTGGNNIMIGANAEVPSGTASNQISIANLIYATGATSTPNAGNVGIGTNAPTTKFEVAGTAKATTLQSTNVQTTNFQMTAGASNNFVLRSDASGNANWVNSNSLSITENDPKIGGQSTNYVPKWNGTQLVQGVIHDNGFVGINTNSPQAQFHVAATGSNYITTSNQQRSLFFINSGSNINQDVNSSGNILVRADGWIWANGGGFVATSDARIKNIKGITNNEKDLAVLNQIEITDYKYKDEISNGSTLQKKVIAQQLKSVYPIAVNQSTGVIPNVFEVAKSSKVINDKTEITTTKPHDFATGEEVKLILNKSGEKTFRVTVSNPNTFLIAEIINETIFVYGKKVNDLLNVDYDALTTLNISATQQLMKEIEALKADNLKFKAENTSLKAENNQINKTVQAMLNDIKNIKTQLSTNSVTAAK